MARKRLAASLAPKFLCAGQAVCICILSLWILLSCGLEAFYNIDYISEASIGDRDTEIQLPSSSRDGYSTYFTNFVIFYRIYTSTLPVSGVIATPNSAPISTINTQLSNDYSALHSYTDKTSTTVSTSNLENVFFQTSGNRKYFMLALEGADITNVLGTSSLGSSMRIFFSTLGTEPPTLTLNEGTPYILQRATGNSGFNDFNPQPTDRYFLNHPDLRNTSYASATTINPDVAVASNSTTDLLYTYVSMYIAASGKSLELPPRTIYSQPTFLGVFMLSGW